MYNRKPQDGSAAKQAADANRQAQGKAIAADAVGKSDEKPELKARFDRYLGMQEVSNADLTGYQAQLQKVKDLLTASQVIAAWKELRNLSQYQRIDSGISQELANRIESVWSTDKNSFRIDQSNDSLKKDIKQASWNADQMSDTIRQKDLDYNLKQNKRGQQGGKQAPSPMAECRRHRREEMPREASPPLPTPRRSSASSS